MPTTSRPDLEALLRSHLAAFNAREFDRLLDGLTEDVAWRNGDTVFIGRDEVGEILREAGELLPVMEVRSIIGGGDRVAVELVETLEYRGETLVVPIAVFYRFRGDRISAITIYREGRLDRGDDDVADRPTAAASEALVRAHVQAFNDRDLDRYVAAMTEQVIWRTPTDSFVGRDAVEQVIRESSGLMPVMTIRVLIAGPGWVATEMTETYRFSGEERSAPMAVFFGLRDDLVSAISVYREGSAEPVG